ncbi:GNAT family N-acetyltransferase [Fictibacillus fluitans]|uniref:GNAT family N-acetyltransferase n=1 Tax=Fictibacillus fluitans TaxID=3058422 RepID=A0ABT8HZG6_9BACL|nr:GNAT family N-acetyltransferase [Fictibacillus sp. NE201]MDN4526146.1 GNAT family N-acetyltransferase [Fictibacillus sp. NE201]
MEYHQQLSELKNLQHQCETAEDLQLKLNWDMLELRNGNSKENFFHYEEGKLCAFLGIYGFGSKAELCGMVLPAYRRRGIFSQLLKKAIQHAKLEYEEILLNTPENSSSGQAFLKQVPCLYAFSEHQMKWQGSADEASNDISLRISSPSDQEFEMQLDVECFGFSPSKAKEHNQRIKNEKGLNRYVIEKDGKPVGKVRVAAEGGEAWIYGFAVTPAEQGKGIGRSTLKSLISQEQSKGHSLSLDVEADNSNALKLYESCGFTSYCTQDYYRFSL